MSRASDDSWVSIQRTLQKRESNVLALLLDRLCSHLPGMTCREIAQALHLERDSISPRIGTLRRKGLVVESGRRGRETVYSAIEDPARAVPLSTKPKLYKTAIKDAIAEIDKMIERYPNMMFIDHEPGMKLLQNARVAVMELAK